jgi:hypothetical protein
MVANNRTQTVLTASLIIADIILERYLRNQLKMTLKIKAMPTAPDVRIHGGHEAKKLI